MTNDDDNRMRDRELGMDRRSIRRDFLDGIAMGIGASYLGSIPGVVAPKILAAPHRAVEEAWRAVGELVGSNTV